jgi:hypothetical protein
MERNMTNERQRLGRAMGVADGDMTLDADDLADESSPEAKGGSRRIALIGA